MFALTHNYTGYPMVKLARDLVRQGELGPLRKIVVQYSQGWLSTRLERAGHKQAEWRADPKRSGAAGCIGDIGTHAENLAEYITGLKIVELCADLTTFVRGRRLDDDGSILLRLQRGVRGVLFASQISVGEENGLAIRIYGEEKGLEWHQEHPNTLRVKSQDGPLEVWSRGNGYVRNAALRPPEQHSYRPGTRRRSWRPSPTSTVTRPTRCGPDASERGRTRSPSIIRP